jgi:CRISPR/Cas system-associated exonuclease Cas4 (RecB family)
MSDKINNILQSIIKKKYEELEKNKINKNNLYWMIDFFEANAVGQIGETFIRNLIENLGYKIDNKENTHDEYDVKIKDIKIEIKTARKGKNNNTFQFNGFNPKYNYSFIICIGIAPNAAYYKIIKSKIIYVHKDRRYKISLDGKTYKSLVAMNPQNQTNYKLTLTDKDLLPLDNLIEELRKSI